MRAAIPIRRLLILALLAVLLAAGGYRALSYHRIHRFDPLIRSAAERNGVDPALLSAVIWRESNYRPDCTGKAGEIGLMQIREPAGREWAQACAITDFSQDSLFNPCTNIEAGTWYLARALKRWKGRDDPAPFALAEYNAGLTHARRWAALPGAETAEGFQQAVTYPSTKSYIRTILSRYRTTTTN
jgi:soluble lytic murein transglycosylase